MEKINWGIIGCGDVTEIKSGPAFNKVPGSSLVAVMRRDAAKATDYARRHNVPRWYDDAAKLITDPQVNAVYIATPPSSHEKYSIAAINAGKHVYVEKPMALNGEEALRMSAAAAAKDTRMVVAHYRREQPFFKKIKQLVDEKAIGEVRLVDLIYSKASLTKEELAIEKNAWRVDPVIAGGGLFHDLAPHALDLMYHFFGAIEKVNGISTNQGNHYAAADMVSGHILFKNGIVFNGTWCFNTNIESDSCEIIGSDGKISFSIFSNTKFILTINGEVKEFTFDPLQHVQQPMIEKVVQYFLGKASNPCPPTEGAEVMRLVDEFIK